MKTHRSDNLANRHYAFEHIYRPSKTIEKALATGGRIYGVVYEVGDMHPLRIAWIDTYMQGGL